MAGFTTTGTAVAVYIEIVNKMPTLLNNIGSPWGLQPGTGHNGDKSGTATTKTATRQNGDNSGQNGDNSSQNGDNH